MNKKNKKLALNKQIMANLNSQTMSKVKGGEDKAFPTGEAICFWASLVLCPVIGNWLYSDLADKICATDTCFSKQENCTQWGSCGKCG